MTKFNLKKHLILFTTVVYFLSSVVLSHAVETQFWADRKIKSSNNLSHPVLNSVHPGLPFNTDLPVNAQQRDVHTLISAIPLSESLIREVFDPLKNNEKPIVIIQDIHLHPQAQKSIARVLQRLTDLKLIGVIGIEGAFERLDFKPFRSLKNKETLRKAMDVFLEAKLLAAPSYVGLTSKITPPFIVGVDEKTRYKKNVSAYLAAKKNQTRVLREIQANTRRLAVTKSAFLPSSLIRHLEMKRKFTRNLIGLGEYAQNLARQSTVRFSSVDQFVDVYHRELALDTQQIEKERRIVLERLTLRLRPEDTARLLEMSNAYRSGELSYARYYQQLDKLCEAHGLPLSRTPDFQSYIQYVQLSDAINVNELLANIAQMEKRLETEGTISGPAGNYVQNFNRFLLAEKLVKFELTPAEWAAYKEITAQLNKTSQESLIPFEKFYEEADARSQGMIRNLQFFRANNGLEKLPAVIVVGGFHAPLITQYYRQHKTPFILVSPQVTHVDVGEGSSYLTAFEQEKTPLEQLLAQEKLFINPTSVNISDRRLFVKIVASVVLSGLILKGSVVGLDRRIRRIGHYSGRDLYAGVSIPSGKLVLDSIPLPGGKTGYILQETPRVIATAILSVGSFFEVFNHWTQKKLSHSLRTIFSGPEFGFTNYNLPINSFVGYYTSNKYLIFSALGVEITAITSAIYLAPIWFVWGVIGLLALVNVPGWRHANREGRAPPVQLAVLIHGIVFGIYLIAAALWDHSLFWMAPAIVLHVVGDIVLVMRSSEKQAIKPIESRRKNEARSKSIQLHEKPVVTMNRLLTNTPLPMGVGARRTPSSSTQATASHHIADGIRWKKIWPAFFLLIVPIVLMFISEWPKKGHRSNEDVVSTPVELSPVEQISTPSTEPSISEIWSQIRRPFSLSDIRLSHELTPETSKIIKASKKIEIHIEPAEFKNFSEFEVLLEGDQRHRYRFIRNLSESETQVSEDWRIECEDEKDARGVEVTAHPGVNAIHVILSVPESASDFSRFELYSDGEPFTSYTWVENSAENNLNTFFTSKTMRLTRQLSVSKTSELNRFSRLKVEVIPALAEHSLSAFLIRLDGTNGGYEIQVSPESSGWHAKDSLGNNWGVEIQPESGQLGITFDRPKDYGDIKGISVVMGTPLDIKAVVSPVTDKVLRPNSLLYLLTGWKWAGVIFASIEGTTILTTKAYWLNALMEADLLFGEAQFISAIGMFSLIILYAWLHSWVGSRGQVSRDLSWAWHTVFLMPYAFVPILWGGSMGFIFLHMFIDAVIIFSPSFYKSGSIPKFFGFSRTGLSKTPRQSGIEKGISSSAFEIQFPTMRRRLSQA